MAEESDVKMRNNYRCMQKLVHYLSGNMNALGFSSSRIHQSPLFILTSVPCLIPPTGNTFSSWFSLSLKTLENEIGSLQGIHYIDANPEQLS